MACIRAAEIHRYHDGELSPAECRPVQSHLGECQECRELLEKLRQLSIMIAAAPLAAMPADVARRLRRRPQETRERAVLRATGWLTAAAAAVLLGVILTSPAERGDAARPAIWQSLAVMAPGESGEDGGSDLLMARWMADDLSSDKSGDVR